MLDLEVGLVLDFERTPIVKIVIERHGEMRICDGGDESGVSGRRREQMEVVTVDQDVDRQDKGYF